MERVAQNNWSPVGGLTPFQTFLLIGAVLYTEWIFMMLEAGHL